MSFRFINGFLSGYNAYTGILRALKGTFLSRPEKIARGNLLNMVWASRDVQMSAVKKHYKNWFNIQNPTEEMTLLAMKAVSKDSVARANSAMYWVLLHDMCDEILRRNLNTPNINELMIRLDGMNIRYVPEDQRTSQMILDAICDSPSALYYINNPSEELIWMALRSSPQEIEHVKNQTYEMQAYCLNVRASLIEVMLNPAPDLQLKAILEDISLIRYIDIPSEEIVRHCHTHDWKWALGEIAVDYYPEDILDDIINDRDKVLCLGIGAIERLYNDIPEKLKLFFKMKYPDICDNVGLN